MRTLVCMLATLLIVACGDTGNSEAAAAADVDFCTCVNEPMTSNARVKACNNLVNAMTPEETVTKTFACRESLPVPDGGPDLCFCLRTTTRDREILEACQAIIPEDMTPMEMTTKKAACGR
tara:strand:+ start:14720 stop:15082 length:363 start_codon:yes stop_codon:yes gene_type:complete